MGYKKGELYEIGIIRRIFMSYFDIYPNEVELFGEEVNHLAEANKQRELSNAAQKAAAANQST